jgi:hypothetical protein
VFEKGSGHAAGSFLMLFRSWLRASGQANAVVTWCKNDRREIWLIS